MYATALILELAILVLTEESGSDSRQCVCLEKVQALFKGVGNVDLASAVEDDDTASAVMLCQYATERVS